MTSDRADTNPARQAETSSSQSTTATVNPRVTNMLPTAFLTLALINRAAVAPAVPPEVQELEQSVQSTLAGLSKLLVVYTQLRAEAQERCRGRFPTPEEKQEIAGYSTKIAELQKEIADAQELIERVRSRTSEVERVPKK